jgi:PKD repeat protein
MKYDTIPFRYEWKFGDDSRATGRLVEHCYGKPGKYLVQLDAVNLVTNEVLANEKSSILEVLEVEQPYISAPDEALAGQQVKFSADSTNLPGWNIDRYYWSFEDETIAEGKNVQKAYLRPGSYNIQLIITSKPGAGETAKEACVSKKIIIKRQP